MAALHSPPSALLQQPLCAAPQLAQQVDQDSAFAESKGGYCLLHRLLMVRKRLADQSSAAVCQVHHTGAAVVGVVAALTHPRRSSRSTAVVIDPQVRSTFAPSALTGSGPLCRSASRTPKSLAHIPSILTFSRACASSALAAFQSTNQR